MLPEVDIQKSKNNADNLLSNYHRLKRMTGRSIDQKVTTTYTFEPKADSSDNTSQIEREVLRKFDATLVMDNIHKAYHCLNAEMRRRLYLKYMNPQKVYDYEIYTEESISERQYYKELSNALMAFAEAYDHGRLLIYKEG